MSGRFNDRNIKNVYNAIAPGFYDMRQQPLTPELQRLVAEWSKGKLLDIGCGIGNSLLPFAKAGFDCSGLDISPVMLRYTKQYLEKHGVNARLKAGSMTKLPFKNKFDYIISIAAFHHLDTKKKRVIALKQIKHALRKNGRMFLTVWNKPDSYGKDEYIPWHSKGKIYQRYYHFFSPDELRTLLNKAGIKADVYLDSRDRNICVV